HALVKGMWGVAPAAFVTEVHQRTSGNPFFVQEVTNLRLLQGERPGFAVPPGVRQVLGRRLARLSQAAYALLAVSSVVDHELDPELLAGRRRTPDEKCRSRYLSFPRRGDAGPGRIRGGPEAAGSPTVAARPTTGTT